MEGDACMLYSSPFRADAKCPPANPYLSPERLLLSFPRCHMTENAKRKSPLGERLSKYGMYRPACTDKRKTVNLEQGCPVAAPEELLKKEGNDSGLPPVVAEPPYGRRYPKPLVDGRASDNGETSHPSRSREALSALRTTAL